ncbi:cytochrome P450 CYP71AT89 [Salvia divinorum]|uniref:Cytochrome P450 CYP71AT89 n=1 Tax=Salvia divinorum TaxID=28513 RepID=A0ABD1FII6_SALDI
MSLDLGLRPLIVVSSADAVREITRSHDLAFSGHPSLAVFRRLSYGGLGFAFSPYSEAAREMRRISAVHLSSAKRLQSHRPIFLDEAAEMVAAIAAAAESSDAVDLSEAMMSFVSNVVSRVAFGKRYAGRKENPIFDLLHDAEAVLGGFFVGDYFPWLRWVDDLSGAAAKLEKIFRDMDEFCQELIEEHMNPNGERSMDGDFLGVLLKMMRDGSA